MLKEDVQGLSRTLSAVLIVLILVVAIFVVGVVLSKKGLIYPLTGFSTVLGEPGNPCNGDAGSGASRACPTSAITGDPKKPYCIADDPATPADDRLCAECIAGNEEKGDAACQGKNGGDGWYCGHGVTSMKVGHIGAYGMEGGRRSNCHCTSDESCPGPYQACVEKLNHCGAQPCGNFNQIVGDERNSYPWTYFGDINPLYFPTLIEQDDRGCGGSTVCVYESGQISTDVKSEPEFACPDSSKNNAAAVETEERIDNNHLSGDRMCVEEDVAWCGSRVGDENWKYQAVYPGSKCAEKECIKLGGTVVDGKILPRLAGPIEDGVLTLPIHGIAFACAFVPGTVTFALDCLEDVAEQVGLNPEDYIDGVCCKIHR